MHSAAQHEGLCGVLHVGCGDTAPMPTAWRPEDRIAKGGRESRRRASGVGRRGSSFQLPCPNSTGHHAEHRPAQENVFTKRAIPSSRRHAWPYCAAACFPRRAVLKNPRQSFRSIQLQTVTIAGLGGWGTHHTLHAGRTPWRLLATVATGIRSIQSHIATVSIQERERVE